MLPLGDNMGGTEDGLCHDLTMALGCSVMAQRPWHGMPKHIVMGRHDRATAMCASSSAL